jgi:hypothetical protein
MHGKGTYHWPDGRTFAGNYSNDHRNGPGVLKWPDGRECKGHWVNGR